MRASVSFFFTLLLSLRAGAATEAPARRCESIFMSQRTREQLHSREVILSTHAIPDIRELIDPAYFNGARVIIVTGALKSGKTYSIENGVLPRLQARGFKTSYVTLDQFKRQTKNGSDVFSDDFDLYIAKLTEPRVLALDDFKLGNMSFAAYKELARLIGRRHREGKSTILILADELEAKPKYGVEYGDRSDEPAEGPAESADEQEDGGTEILEFLEAGKVSPPSFDIFYFQDQGPRTRLQ